MMMLSGQEYPQSKQFHSDYLPFRQDDGPAGLFIAGVFNGY